MAASLSDKIKLYAVIGLSCVAAVMAYKTFLSRPKTAALAAPPGSGAVYDIPELPDWLDGAAPTQWVSRSSYRPPPRDLLAPAPDKTKTGANEAISASLHAAPPRLTAVMRGKNGSLAVIDGHIMRVGQSVGGYTIEKIGHNQAVLVREDETVVLKIGQ